MARKTTNRCRPRTKLSRVGGRVLGRVHQKPGSPANLVRLRTSPSPSFPSWWSLQSPLSSFVVTRGCPLLLTVRQSKNPQYPYGLMWYAKPLLVITNAGEPKTWGCKGDLGYRAPDILQFLKPRWPPDLRLLDALQL